MNAASTLARELRFSESSATYRDSLGTVRVTLRKTPSSELELNVACSQGFGAALEQALSRIEMDYESDPCGFEATCAAVIRGTAPALAEAICDARRTDVLAFHLTGINFAAAPATPSESRPGSEASVYSALLAGVLGLFGFGGFSYASENDGLILRVVAPLWASRVGASSQGATEPLGPHADNAHLAIPYTRENHASTWMNEVQSFVTVTPKRRLPMCFLPLGYAIAYMQSRDWHTHLTVLQEPRFTVIPPQSHAAMASPAAVAVLSTDEFGRFRSRYHSSNIQAMDAEGLIALHALAAAIEAVKSFETKVPGHRGEVLWYINPRVLHRRTAFTPLYDGRDRFYLRVYAHRQEHFARFGIDNIERRVE